MAAGITFTEITHTSAKKIIAAWESKGAGVGEGTIGGTTANAFDGKVLGMTTIPDGVAAPTDNYDIVIKDSNSHDVLLGQGLNRHTSNTQHVVEANLGAVAGSKLTVDISAAGNSKKGTIILWIR